jgi:hypothetical protein
MNPNEITFDRFTCTRPNGSPRWRLPLTAESTLQVFKLDECEKGYLYSVSVLCNYCADNLLLGTGWFSGFGTGGSNDVLDFVRAYIKAFYSED